MKKFINIKYIIIVFVFILSMQFIFIECSTANSENSLKNINVPTINELLEKTKNDRRNETRILTNVGMNLENESFNYLIQNLKDIINLSDNNIDKTMYIAYMDKKNTADKLVATNESTGEYIIKYAIINNKEIDKVLSEFRSNIESLVYMYKFYSLISDDDYAIIEKNYTISRYEKSRMYAKRAYDEIELMCTINWADNWNFLSTSSTAYVCALGYDWLYDYLNDIQKNVIEQGIIYKALIPSSQYSYSKNFESRKDNWNLVCNSGLGIAAISLLNKNNERLNNTIEISSLQPCNDIKQILNTVDNNITYNELCAAIVIRSIEKMPIVWNEMNGAYGEGASYYLYGITYYTRFIATLNATVSDDFGLTEIDGFKENLLYLLYIQGLSNFETIEYPNKNLLIDINGINFKKTYNSGSIFNYADANKSIYGLSTLMYLGNQYAEKDNQFKNTAKILTWYNIEYMKCQDIEGMLWYRKKYDARYDDGTFKEVTEEKLKNMGLKLNNVIQAGENIATFRSSFTYNKYDNKSGDDLGLFVAIKAGNNQTTHGDLDVGSFVLDALGTRWIEDYGKASYNYDRGYFEKTTYRWNVYSKRAEAHNTLIINPSNSIKETRNSNIFPYYAEADQYIYAETEIVDYYLSDNMSYAILDLTDAYNANDNNINKNIDSNNENGNTVKRGIKTIDRNSRVILQDEILFDSNKENNEIYWFINLNNDNLEYQDVTNENELKEGNWTIIISNEGKKAKIIKYPISQQKKVLMIDSLANGNFEIMNATTINENLLPNENLNDIQNDYLKANSFQNKKKLAIHIENIKENEKITICTLFTPILNENDYLKEIPDVVNIDSWEKISFSTLKEIDINNVKCLVNFDLEKNNIKDIIELECKDIDEKYTIKFYNNNNEILEDSRIGTGDILKIIKDNKVIYEYTTIIYGDLNGDGKSNSADALLIIKNKLNNGENLNDIYREAGKISEYTKKNKVLPSSVDALAIIKYKLEKIEILQ